MKFRKILVMILSAVVLMGCTSCEPPTNTYKQVTAEEAMSMMDSLSSPYIILDVRTPAEFAQGHIPNAINIPNETIGTEEIPQLPNKKQVIFVYCRSGNRSKQAAEKLVQLGYTNVVEFGGINDWPGDITTD
ncbi:MAG: rhodanese-like domain-containing protein [Clostridia bacterium]|nr:rhodanese-like domain-containing protein [Clostridia bacterium]MBQ9707129.1 rhodanese-like domain-containing protein [Clostridia bacterium]